MNFSPQSTAARLVHAGEGLHISSQVMLKVNPLDHQEDQPIFQHTIFNFEHFQIILAFPLRRLTKNFRFLGGRK